VLYDRERRKDFEHYFGVRLCTYQMDEWVFTEQNAHQKLYKHFNVKSLKGFGVDHLKSGVIAAGAILQYLEQTLHTQIAHITTLSRIEEEGYVRLDKFTVRSLELVRTMQEGGKSLLDVVDHTVSPMGGRLLRRWLIFPLKDEKPINDRLDIVDYFFRHPDFRQTIDEQLQFIGDLERIVSKVATGRVSPREMVQLRKALQAIVPIKAACQESENESLREFAKLAWGLLTLNEPQFVWESMLNDAHALGIMGRKQEDQ
jgi:DNA mismatch repair protein MutS